MRYLRGKIATEVELVEGGVLGLDLLPFLENRDKAIFIDALDAGQEPGAVFRFSPAEVPCREDGPPISLHDLGLYQLIAAAQLLDQCPENITVIAVQVKSMEPGSGLSEEVSAALPTVHRLVEEELGGRGEA